MQVIITLNLTGTQNAQICSEGKRASAEIKNISIQFINANV